MTSEQIAKKHGYRDAQEASKAILAASLWIKKHPGKQAPTHIVRAAKLVAEIEGARLAEHVRTRRLMGKLARDPRVFFAAIPKGVRLERFRRWARAKFNLYFGEQEILEHFSRLVPPDFAGYFVASDADNKLKAVKSLADSIVRLYGVAERKNCLATVNAGTPDERFSPWGRGELIAWQVIAVCLKSAVRTGKLKA